MVTRLTFIDYKDPDWGTAEACSDWNACRVFWTCVLQVATADQGTAVHYQLDAGDDCLAIEVDGQTYAIVPPEEEYRKHLLWAARRLACGGWLRLLTSLVLRPSPLGSIRLQMPGGDVLWHVHTVGSGLRFTRAG